MIYLHSVESYRVLTMDGRNFEKGDSTTTVAVTPTLGDSLKMSFIWCVTRCLPNKLCSRFVYNMTSRQCKRYKCIYDDPYVTPVGDDPNVHVYSVRAGEPEVSKEMSLS